MANPNAITFKGQEIFPSRVNSIDVIDSRVVNDVELSVCGGAPSIIIRNLTNKELEFLKGATGF